MNGTIVFSTAESLAEFLKSFVGCTATFEVREESRGYVLTFTGGF